MSVDISAGPSGAVFVTGWLRNVSNEYIEAAMFAMANGIRFMVSTYWGLIQDFRVEVDWGPPQWITGSMAYPTEPRSKDVHIVIRT